MSSINGGKFKELLDSFQKQQQQRSLLETEIKQLQVHNERKEMEIKRLSADKNDLQQSNFELRARESSLQETTKALEQELDRHLSQKSSMQLTLTDLENKAQSLQENSCHLQYEFMEKIEILTNDYLESRKSFKSRVNSL